ncbi:MAG: hypothetical protein GEV11_29030 [Streptosporangiales bacterium]|nr:hypothetical protein [Streptosporangiales bacterium]
MTEPRTIRVAAAQLGPIPEDEGRASVVNRLVALATQAADARAELVVFPELALTTYFPKRIRDDFDQFFDVEMPNPSVEPLFATARSAGLAFCLRQCDTFAATEAASASARYEASSARDALVTLRTFTKPPPPRGRPETWP